MSKTLKLYQFIGDYDGFTDPTAPHLSRAQAELDLRHYVGLPDCITVAQWYNARDAWRGDVDFAGDVPLEFWDERPWFSYKVADSDIWEFEIEIDISSGNGLLIPDYDPNESLTYPGDIKPGLYIRNEVVELLRKNKDNASAIQFLSDMMEQ